MLLSKTPGKRARGKIHVYIQDGYRALPGNATRPRGDGRKTRSSVRRARVYFITVNRLMNPYASSISHERPVYLYEISHGLLPL
jgi:hypothetical protein